MVEDLKVAPFNNGYWDWDDFSEALNFNSNEGEPIVQQSQSIGDIQSQKTIFHAIRFRTNLNRNEKVKFRKYLKRKVKIIEPNVVTIQDLKDVAIYHAFLEDLSVEFISYFHTEKVDKFLRSLIVYFTYYFQVWNNIMLRRTEAARKLRQPLVTILENQVRDNLADLRSILARNYSYMILGLDDVKQFYHMKNETLSLSDKERHLFESLITISARVVYIAFYRKNLPLIEIEMARMFRTDNFNLFIHGGAKTAAFQTRPEEDRILLGAAFVNEQKLIHRSPAVQELIFGDHDYKLLAISLLDIADTIERLEYLEAAYAAPEEDIIDLGVGLGILGAPRTDFDTVLFPRKAVTKKDQFIAREIPEFKIPPKPEEKHVHIVNSLPSKLCKYQETEQTLNAREHQCKLWRQYLLVNMRKPSLVMRKRDSAQSTLTSNPEG